jgi:hypothetical protein
MVRSRCRIILVFTFTTNNTGHQGGWWRQFRYWELLDSRMLSLLFGIDIYSFVLIHFPIKHWYGYLEIPSGSSRCLSNHIWELVQSNQGNKRVRQSRWQVLTRSAPCNEHSESEEEIQLRMLAKQRATRSPIASPTTKEPDSTVMSVLAANNSLALDAFEVFGISLDISFPKKPFAILV